MMDWLSREVLADPAPRHILVFSHGIAIRALLVALLELPHDAWASLPIENTSVSTLRFAQGALSAHTLNDTTHLRERGIARLRGATDPAQVSAHEAPWARLTSARASRVHTSCRITPLMMRPLLICLATLASACGSVYTLPPPAAQSEPVSLIPGEDERAKERLYLEARAAILRLNQLLASKRYREALGLDPMTASIADLQSAFPGQVEADGLAWTLSFFECEAGRCGSLQYTAGFANETITAEMVNRWNGARRYLKAYFDPQGPTAVVQYDVDIGPGDTTVQLTDSLRRWAVMLPEFATHVGYFAPPEEGAE